ncbi:MAG: multicopper oxidase domain-containing protein [Betaproteobacteria bacterium]
MNKPYIPERRDFLSGLAAAGLLGLTGCGGGDSGDERMTTDGMGRGNVSPPTGLGAGALRLPANFSGDTLSTRAGAYDLGAGARSGALLYNGQWPSPLIRLSPGSTLDITLQNQLAEATNIHWHGLAAAAGMDGHPTEVAAPGAIRRYNFAVNERPGTYWYHPHPHGATARQAYFGLAGLLIVDDGNDAARGLPTGIRDIPLVLADKRVSNGSLIYQPDFMDIMTGWLGNVMTVNGAAGPVTTGVEAAVIRLRLLNASNARVLNPALASGRSFWLIGTDGGLLAAPVAVNSLLLAPGERADVLIDLRGDAGQTIKLVSAAFSMAGGMMGSGMMSAAPSQGSAFDLVTFSVSAAPGGNPGTVPATLSPIARFDLRTSAGSRKFELTAMGAMTSGLHRINGLSYDSARIDFVVRRGDLERWQFINFGMEPHPMHVHGTQFQVVSRDGNAATRFATDLGWKDTVLVRSMESVEIALRFSMAGNYVLHCHNLEHEDDGMMLNFNVV